MKEGAFHPTARSLKLLRRTGCLLVIVSPSSTAPVACAAPLSLSPASSPPAHPTTSIPLKRTGTRPCSQG
jgi:hypothetical protein